jgi:phage shock protein PspC (stress-responsive transcriptional regulator)
MFSDASPAPPLRRALNDRVLLGVCGGLARTLGVRPLLVRGGAVLLAAVAFPLMAVAYAALALIVPRDDGRVLLGGEPADGREQLLGWSAVLFGGMLVLAAGFDPHQLVWPALSRGGLILAALAIGALLLREGRGGTAAPAVPGAPAPGTPPATTAAALPVPVSRPAVPARPGDAAAGEEPTVRIAGPGREDEAPTRVAPTAVRPAPSAAPGGVAAPSRRRTGLLVAGIVALVLAGLATAGAVAVAAIGGVGDTTKRPATAEDVRSEYRLGVGSLDIDLREATFRPGTVTDLRARLGAGSLTVFVAPGVRVESVGATELTGVERVNRAARERAAQERAAAGVRASRGRATRGGASATPVVRIDADVTLGSGAVIAPRD